MAAFAAGADDEDTRARAESIAAEYAVRHPLYLPAMPDGVQATGIDITPDSANFRYADAEDIALDFRPPETFEPDRILAVLLPTEEPEVRIRWERRAATANTAPDTYTIRIAHPKGYPRYEAVTDPQRPAIEPTAVGAVAWTRHTVERVNSAYPGVYNVFLVASNGTATAVGQVFILGAGEWRDDVKARMQSRFSDDAILFAGHLALSRWYNATFELDETDIGAYTLEVLSSADWVADTEDGVPVAEVVVTLGDGSQLVYPLIIGIDTAQTQNPSRAASPTQPNRAQIAWRWKIEDNGVDIEAHVYRATYMLRSAISPPTSIMIRYLLDEGVLRVRGLALVRD